MRSFIVSVFSVAIFFIGVSALVNDVSAKFGSDAKAKELIQKSRIAIGGDSNINSVKSMTIEASVEYFGGDRAPNKQIGELEINFEMPNRFSKMITIGTPGEGNDGKKVKNIETVIVSGDDSADADGKQTVTIHKMGDEDGGKWTTEDGKTVILREKDGTTEDADSEGKTRVFVFRNGAEGTKTLRSEDGKTIVIEKENIVTDDIKGGEIKQIVIRDKAMGGDKKWTSNDGKTVTIDEIGGGDIHFQAEGFPRTSEFLRTTLALLMTAPESEEVKYTFAGTGDVDGRSSNIIDVESKGAMLKLYLDASTNLPQMVSYTSRDFSTVFTTKDEKGNIQKERVIEMKKGMSDAKEVEHQIKFSDFRKVGNLNLPHLWKESKDGKAEQNVNVKSFAVNPADIGEKFKNEKVFVRKMKTNN